ncbi:hypothetical protein, partial [Sulfitobacter sp. DFL-23]
TLPTGVAASCHDEYRYRIIQDTRLRAADDGLDARSLTALKKMQKAVSRAISTHEEPQKAETRTKVEAVAREMGYSLAELVGSDSKPKRISVAPTYQQLRTRRHLVRSWA